MTSALLHVVCGLLNYFAALFLLLPITLASVPMIGILLLPIGLYQVAVKLKNKKLLYYTLLAQLIQNFTTSGIVMGFFSGLTWKNYHDGFDSTITCVPESPFSPGFPFYLTGVLLHVTCILLFIFGFKLMYWMMAKEKPRKE